MLQFVGLPYTSLHEAVFVKNGIYDLYSSISSFFPSTLH